MGVNMSITKNAKYGKPAYAALGKVDEEGAEGAEGAEEAAAPALEANSETIDKIKQENFDKWSKIFRDITRNKKIEKKIKSSFNKFKTEKLEGKTTDSDESSKPQEGGEGDDAPAPAGDDAPAPAGDAPADMNDFMKFYSKGIKSSEDKVFEYMSGDDNYSFFLKEDIDKFWLVDEKVKELLDEQTAGLIVELGKNEKKFKKANEAKYNELSDVVTKITKEIVPIMFEKTQIAVQHKALKDILEYAIGSDELKDFHKKQNISGQKEAIKSGDVSADEVAMEKREKEAEAKEQKAAEEGPSGGDGYSSDSSGGDDSSYGGYSSDSGDSYMSGGDNIDGGKLFKTAEEKEYKKFKGEERKEFAEKKDKFMKDEVKVIAFLDANIESLMTSYKKNKIGVNVQKSSMKTNTALLEAIFTAVNSYEKEVETTGAAIEMIAKSGEAPAAGEKGEGEGEGDKKDGKGEGEKDGAAGEKDGDGAGAGEKDGAEEKKNEDGAEEGGNQGGGGSHTTVKSTKTKKKRQPKKLPKNINININLGKTNIAYEDTSDSDSSTSDSSSSDSDDEEQGNVIKKGKKQVKYVVNTTAPKKKNRTKRRRQTNDEE